MSINRIQLIGHLGADPKLGETDNRSPFLSFRMATSESYTDRQDQRQERTEWHRVTLWGKEAELLSRVLCKGSQVYVDGSLRTRSYESQGQKKYVTEVVARQVLALGTGDRQGGSHAA